MKRNIILMLSVFFNTSTTFVQEMPMQSSCLIRSVQLSDAPVVASLITQLGYPISDDDMIKRIEIYLQQSRYNVWVAQVADTVVGCIAVQINDNFHLLERTMRIISLVVDATYRRMGIGKKLVEHAEKQALAQGCDTIELTSGVQRAQSGAHDFYKLLGYIDLHDQKKYLAKKLTVQNSNLYLQKDKPLLIVDKNE